MRNVFDTCMIYPRAHSSRVLEAPRTPARSSVAVSNLRGGKETTGSYQVRLTFYQLKTDCRPTLNVNAARLHRMRAIVDENIRLKFPTYMRAFLLLLLGESRLMQRELAQLDRDQARRQSTHKCALSKIKRRSTTRFPV